MKSKYLRVLRASVLFLLMASGLAPAFAATVYSVDRTIGTGGVSGYITTDGTLGTLTATNLIDWQLLLDDGLDTFTLQGPLSGANSVVDVVGTAFSASASDLLFDFSAAGGQLVLFQNPYIGSAINNWCFDTVVGGQNQCADVNPDESVGVVFQVDQRVDRTGLVSIGTTAVPVPAAIWLFASGLLGLAGITRRKAA